MLSYDALSSLDLLKDFLGIQSGDSDSQRDRILMLALDSASMLVQNYTDRRFKQKNVTEYYDGTGTAIIMLNRYPVHAIDSVYDDLDRDFESDSLISSSNYTFYEDEGILRLFKDYGGFSIGKKNVKVTYDGGFGFKIESSINDRLDFDEGSGELTATLTAGDYSIVELASHIETTLNAVSGVSGTYTVKYSFLTGKFTISVSGASVSLLCNTGTNWDRNAYPLIGFDTDSDQSSTSSHTSEYSVFGLPGDVVIATNMVAGLMYENTRFGDSRLGRLSRSISGGGGSGSDRFVSEFLTDEVKSLLDPYSRSIV